MPYFTLIASNLVRSFLFGRTYTFSHLHPRFLNSLNHYDSLGLKRDATQKEIRSAFVELSKQYHPDINKDPDTHKKFIKIKDAYTVLKNSSSRNDYNILLDQKLYDEQVLRNMSSSHTYGNSNRPGPQPDSENEQVFWDETIWHMRDKSKDSYYRNRPYYGVKSVKKKLTNQYVVVGCVCIIIFGVFLHLLAMTTSSHMRKDYFDERDKRLHREYMAARNKAYEYGNSVQLQTLASAVPVKSQPAENSSSEV